MMEAAATEEKLNTELIIDDILNTIEREREREIVARRFGLYDRKETLEQIGELLNITRERVRQLEKSVISKLKNAAGELPHISSLEANILEHLENNGHIARISDLTEALTGNIAKLDQSRLTSIS